MPAATIKTIPQLSQLDIKFCGPLWADMQVNNLSELDNIQFKFDGKLVWVKSENTWYYWCAAHTTWEKQDSRSTITVYDLNKTYLPGECVFLDGKIYSALQEIGVAEAPTNTYDTPKWLCISGVTASECIVFDNMSVVEFATKIVPPLFDIWVTSEDGQEHIMVPPTQIDEHNYRIEFYEDRELVRKSGYIYIK